jgi:aryl sulfotransferase
MTGLVVVASYPKSGNTWTRAVFEHLRRGPGWDFSINGLPTGYYGPARRVLFDMLSPVNAADLYFEEIDDMLPNIFRTMVREDPSMHIVKVHDDARQTKSGEWLYPPDAVASVVYLVRHPFDVAVSFSNHMSIEISEMVELMKGTDAIVRPVRDQLALPLPQHVGSWSSNIESWLDNPNYEVTLARYEDLHFNPIPEFTRLARAAGLPSSQEEVVRAVNGSQFERMRDEEKESGFRERPPTSKTFFRAGKPMSWDGILSEELRNHLVRDHGAMMERLGYLPDGGIARMQRPIR